MKYAKVVEAEFLSRPNRFIAKVILEGREEVVHVKNTGRCKELLIPGVKVYLEESPVQTRKTKYDLIAVEKKNTDGTLKLINMDSQAPNKAAAEWLESYPIFGKTESVRAEVYSENSRFDFAVTGELGSGFVEVKGVTLEDNGVVMFLDAPTERGVKHLKELTELSKKGIPCAVVFVIQMSGVRYFTPNSKTHPQFSSALKEAGESGVKIVALTSHVTPDTMVIDSEVEVQL